VGTTRSVAAPGAPAPPEAAGAGSVEPLSPAFTFGFSAKSSLPNDGFSLTYPGPAVVLYHICHPGRMPEPARRGVHGHPCGACMAKAWEAWLKPARQIAKARAG